jgi:tripartite-type tricarboxylate transporter receptor subunit TctC
LAVTTAKRSPAAPDLPTMAEAGLPGFEMDGWFGLLAPARTPPEIVKVLNQALNAVVRDERFAARFAQLGAAPLGGTPEEFAAFMKAEDEKWGKVIREAGIKPE